MSASLDRSKEPAPGVIRDYHVPAVHSRKLHNGIRSLVCTAGDIPLVTAHAVIHAGTGTERRSQSGIAMLTANALEGGTRTLSGTELAWNLEELGLELSAWTTWDATHVRITATTERIDAALRLLADIVRNPAFPVAEVERIRDEQIAELMQRANEPRALGDDMAARFIYAPGSPYHGSIYGCADSVQSMSADDVRAFHSARYQPDSTALLLVGDIDPDRGHALVNGAFGDWTGSADRPLEINTDGRTSNTTIHLVDRPGSVQSELRIGHVGVQHNHPDHFALLVLNAILGGAFTSRLNLSLREKHGFTYGVRSTFGFRRAPGPFVIQTAVGTEVTSRAVKETFREIRLLLSDGVAHAEVENNRNYLAGVFPLQLQSTEELAARLAEIVIYDLPDDYFQHYRSRILGINRDAVEKAARVHIEPARMAVIIVGDAATLRQDLEKIAVGQVVIEAAGPVEQAGIHG